MRRLLGLLAPRQGGCRGVRARRRPVAPIAAQRLATRLGRRHRRPGPLADQLPLLLRHRRIDPQHQLVGTGHVRSPQRVAFLQQLRQRVGTAGDAIQPGGNQGGAELAAAAQRRLEARPAVVLAAGDVGELADQDPALAGDEGTDAGLLGLEAKAALALLGGRHPVEADGVAGGRDHCAAALPARHGQAATARR